MGSIKWLRPAKPFFPNVNLRAIHSELKRQTMEIRQCGSPPLSPPFPAKMGRGVYLQQIWWIARMDPFAEKKRHRAIFCLDCLLHRQIAHPVDGIFAP